MEHLTIDWPAEYKWKIVGKTNDSSKRSITIIPGNENTTNASIIGTIVAYKGLHYASLDELVKSYKSGLDTGSVLTILERGDKNKQMWMLFKVETPKTAKYPEPESDLYYVLQGKYALFENYVAIKEPILTSDFVNKWSNIFKSGRLEMD